MADGGAGGLRVEGFALNGLMHTLSSRPQKESPSQLPTSRSMREPDLSFSRSGGEVFSRRSRSHTLTLSIHAVAGPRGRGGARWGGKES